MTADNIILTTLQAHGLRITQSRIAVAEVLIANADVALTVEDTFHQIQQQSELHCDLVSVYRILAKFAELNLVNKSHFQGDAVRFVYTDPERRQTAHEHYFKCIKCDVIEAFKGCFLKKKEQELAKQGYTQLSHHVEITGICPSCA